MLSTKAVVLAGMEDPKQAAKAFQDLMDHVFPFLQQQRGATDEMRQRMEKEMQKGLLRIRPISSTAEARQLRSKLTSNHIAKERERYQQGMARFKYLELD